MLICQGSNKEPQAGGLNNLLFSGVKSKRRGQGGSLLGCGKRLWQASPRGMLMAVFSLSTRHLSTILCVPTFFFYKDNGHIGLGSK